MFDKDDAAPKGKPFVSTSKWSSAGARKIKFAMRAHHAMRKDQAVDDLKARNAYRAACGLPLIEPGND